MTVLTTTSDISYSGLTGQSAFPYNFRVDDKEDMVVTLDFVAISQNDFTITGLGSAVGGTVTLVTPLAAPALIVLSRQLLPTQEVDYQPFDPFPADTHEFALDKLTMLVQEGSTSVLRSLRFPVGDNANPVLPDVATRNAKYMAFDGAGEVVAIEGTNETPNAVLKPATAVVTNDLMMFDASKNALDSGFSIATLIDLFLPVTTVVTYTTSAINPNILYPNTIWVPLTEGQFLISQGAGFPGGSTGGSADAIIVNHTHIADVADPGHTHLIDAGFNDGAAPEAALDNAVNLTSTRVSQSSVTGITVSNQSTGVSGVGLNIPPYLAVYPWERVAALPPGTPEFDAHWARVTDKTCPTIEADLRTLFNELITNGLWDSLDDLCVIHCNAADSLLGIKGFQDSVHAGPVPDWSATRGYRVGSTEDFEEPDPNLTNWIDSGILDTGLTNFRLDSRVIFFQMLSPDFTVGVNEIVRGSMGGLFADEGEKTSISISEVDSVFTDEGGSISSVINTAGFYLGSRQNALTMTFLADNDFQTLPAPTNAALPNTYTMLVGAEADTGGLPLSTEFYTSDMVAWGVGGGLDQTESEILRDIILAYTTARGVAPDPPPVIPTPEFDAHWARVVDKSNATLEADLRALFTSLIDSGVYALLDDLCVIHSSAADSLLGLKGFQDSALPVGQEPLFDVNEGFITRAASDGGGAWVDTVIDGNLVTNFSVGSMTAFTYMVNAVGVNFAGQVLMGVQDTAPAAINISYTNSLGTTAAVAIGTAVVTNIPQIDEFGFYGLTRTDISVTGGELIRHNVITATTTISDAAAFVFTPAFVGGQNLGGSLRNLGQTGTQSHVAWGIGGGLTSLQLATLESALDVYMLARGVN